ncbi:LysE family translocator [Taklimakanibacter deserti]|uniref:LysE family translocator n=1 Tax=Taklimakanibacter deserti TaxID=2267839 RepID=UPI000E650C39
MDWQTIAPFLTATILLLLMPGPVMAIVSHNTLRGGAATGIATVLGVELGRLLALSATLAGLVISGELLPSLFQWLSLAGIVYLAWLAFRALRRVPRGPTADHSGRPFFDGLAVSLSNPVALGFYTAFFPQFIRPGHSIALQATILGALFLATSFILELVLVFAMKRFRQSGRYDPTRFGNLAALGSAVIYMSIAAVAAFGL